jgi:RHS repeat-associated protein
LNTSDNYSYDTSGNLTADANSQSYIYDGENKMLQASNGSGALAAYYYDGDGKRVKKVVPNGETTIFVYDGYGKLIVEYSTQLNSAPQTSYLTSDNLRSPRINTDTNGKVTSRHDYHPFGEEIISSQRISGVGYQSDSIRKQFTRYEADNESGLDFAEARYYFKKHARFNSADPENAGASENDPQSWNGYGYSRNNPLTYVDPDGQKWEVCDTSGACTTISDDEARKTLLNRDGNHPEVVRKDGNIYENGVLSGTYERTSFDDLSDQANALIFGYGKEPGMARRAPTLGRIVNGLGAGAAALIAAPVVVDAIAALGASSEMAAAFEKAVEYASHGNKLIHIFSKAERAGKMAELAAEAGGKENLIKVVIAQLLSNPNSIKTETLVKVGETTLKVSYTFNDGILKIGSIWPAGK